MGLFGKTKKKDVDERHDVTLSDGATYGVVKSVDCLGDSCPRPQLMTKKAIGQIDVGEVIEVMVDNPSSVEALPPLCDDLGATHLETVKDARCWKVYIRKD
ncbi:sulfurtransferase TusA family protein [Varunaivibrio sulfuroxidans]|uniref:tRNA 2-thiouridine synthesizing protein A n=1 Tax=Varunaivibrio sulfuroxidans TaxID=1773489 RepID=A0A4R3J6X1_9PROT|nr:sulfurtransferase TusA family protein [Varunaivibrio sulfuroxidans]TCS60606.1 tRNA 2-thiouridine synthesizing protein A [Varunaivibrio sulfuroxidans]WES30095.1 sulfurtransferase TusA family protein [Varunaivibrio sulfuroxidans]